MTKMTMFQGGALPAHLKGKADSINDAAMGGIDVTSGMRALRHKGKKWSVRVGDEDKIFKDASGRNAIDLYVAIVAVRQGKSKRYYPGKWQEDSKRNVPMSCFSVDGVKPDKVVKMPEHGDCARCEKNEYGSADNGKGKACTDQKRVVLVPLDKNTINGDGSIEGGTLASDPLRWDIPAMSLKNFGAYAQLLKDHGAPMNGVITCMRIDEETDYPLIQFAPAGWLSKADYSRVEELAESDDVIKIIDGEQERYSYKRAHEDQDEQEDNEQSDQAHKEPTFSDADGDSKKGVQSSDGDASAFDDKMKDLGVEGF